MKHLGVLEGVVGPASYPSLAMKSVAFLKRSPASVSRRRGKAVSFSALYCRNKKHNIVQQNFNLAIFPRFLLARSEHWLSYNKRANAVVCYFHTQSIALAFALEI